MPYYAYRMLNDDGCLVEVIATEAANDDQAIAMMETLRGDDGVAAIQLRRGTRLIHETRTRKAS
jgi:hypothetical protein